jgi:hypothetical protein
MQKHDYLKQCWYQLTCVDDYLLRKVQWNLLCDEGEFLQMKKSNSCWNSLGNCYYCISLVVFYEVHDGRCIQASIHI